MRREEILTKMLTKEPRMLFPTMALGGNTKQLRGMEDDGLISSARRYDGNYRQRDWYLTADQAAAASLQPSQQSTP